MEKGLRILVVILITVVAIVVILNVGRPFFLKKVDTYSLRGVLSSIGLLKNGGFCGIGELVTPCVTDDDCEDCVEKCGRTGFCVASCKKECKKDGSCKEEDDECPCSGSGDMINCEACTEYCKPPFLSVGGLPSPKCKPTGNKTCLNGDCIDEDKDCKCETDSDCEDCQKCSGSPDYICEFNSDKYIECGESCCRKNYSATEKMKCCKDAAELPGACCKESDTCNEYDGKINFCVIPESDCDPDTEKLCTATDTGLAKCCPKNMGCKGKYLPTCTVKEGECPEVKRCYDFGSGDVLCCTDKEKCIEEDIFKICLAVECESDEFICPGTGALAELTECCKLELEECDPDPTGRPKCLPSLSAE